MTEKTFEKIVCPVCQSQVHYFRRRGDTKFACIPIDPEADIVDEDIYSVGTENGEQGWQCTEDNSHDLGDLEEYLEENWEEVANDAVNALPD